MVYTCFGGEVFIYQIDYCCFAFHMSSQKRLPYMYPLTFTLDVPTYVLLMSIMIASDKYCPPD